MSSINSGAEFNQFTAQWKNRIEFFLRSIFLVSGGVMSITVSAFFALKPVTLPAATKGALIISWYSFTLSLATSIAVSLVLVVSGALVLSKWKRDNIAPNSLVDAPKWIYVMAWTLAATSLSFCFIGLTAIAYAGHQLIVSGVS